MLEPILTNRFKKELTLMKRRGKNIADLKAVMECIQDEQPLPPALRNHPLHGEYTGKQECHIEDDWLLIYKVRPEAGSVTFYRTGSHADSF
ncbi:MAG: type II toxin-antitoxin system YafQ family toxin [Spirochaetaceae bacterium]|jgi:mRNA interferase YafQ|nr:type II toxin-antitoxin system YafQ family toxin [Spirochaetaceae bacterium]